MLEAFPFLWSGADPLWNNEALTNYRRYTFSKTGTTTLSEQPHQVDVVCRRELRPSSATMLRPRPPSYRQTISQVWLCRQCRVGS